MIFPVKTKIIKTDFDWKFVKNACRNTVNKSATEVEPTNEFKKKMLISEHSPIRSLKVKWIWEGLKSWVSVHFARHWLGWEKYISTQRSDRTNINRDKSPQDTPVNMIVDANVQALINVGRVRLCYQASPETRMQMENLKTTLKISDEEISNVIVPNCIYRNGCPEFEMCKERFYAKFLMYCKENELPTNTIQQRYDAYNKFYNVKVSYMDTEN